MNLFVFCRRRMLNIGCPLLSHCGHLKLPRQNQHIVWQYLGLPLTQRVVIRVPRLGFQLHFLVLHTFILTTSHLHVLILLQTETLLEHSARDLFINDVRGVLQRVGCLCWEGCGVGFPLQLLLGALLFGDWFFMILILIWGYKLLGSFWVQQCDFRLVRMLDWCLILARVRQISLLVRCRELVLLYVRVRKLLSRSSFES